MPPRRLEQERILAALRAAGNPLRGRAFDELYEHLQLLTPVVLGKFRKTIGDDDQADLFHDTLSVAKQIVEAADPCAFFAVALRRRAISWVRARKNASKQSLDDTGDAGEQTSLRKDDAKQIEAWAQGDAPDGDFVLDAAAFLFALPERDREVLIAVALGDDREEIAARFNTSRVNVDQIVCRARKAFEAHR